MRLDERQRALAAAQEVPLLRFQASSGLPYWAFGLVCGLLVLGMLLVPALLTLDDSAHDEVLGFSLFFGVTFALLATFTTPVYRGVAKDLRALTPILPLDDADVEVLARGLTRATGRQVTAAVLIGIVAGMLHSYILGHYGLALYLLVPRVLATVGLWVVMVATVTKMVLNAAVFSRLGNIAQPDLLRPSSQAPFGAAAIRPALFLIAILCAYPLLAIGDQDPMDSGVWLGVAGCVVSLVGIVAMPLGGIRERIQERRLEILKALDERLEAIGSADLGTVSADTLKDMDTILDMRERVAHAPGWPLDLAGVRRILFYIVLPPLTWAAAALVEMFIDGVV